jgi:diguanylate cyclase
VHNHDREQSFAKTALALMTDVGVAATPDNFELFYAYASGENPALTQLMAAFIHAKKEFTSEILSDLKLRCLSGARTAQMMDSLGGNIDGLIEKVLSQLESSARDTADYKDTLRRPPASWWWNAAPPMCASWWTAWWPQPAPWNTAPRAWKANCRLPRNRSASCAPNWPMCARKA